MTAVQIVDRSSALWVRHFALFALIALAVVIPLSALQYYVAGVEDPASKQFIAGIQHPGSASAQQIADAERAMFAPFALVVCATLLLAPFATAATAVAVGGIGDRGYASFGASYGGALRRLLPLVGAAIGQIAIYAGVAIFGGFVLGIAFGIAAVALKSVPLLGAIAAGIAGAVTIAWIGALLLCYVATAFAFDAIAVEGSGAGAALAQGFERVFNRTEFGRAVLIAFAILLVSAAMFVAEAIAMAFLSMAPHPELFALAVQTIGSTVTASFIAIVVAVYYFELRGAAPASATNAGDLMSEIERLLQTAETHDTAGERRIHMLTLSEHDAIDLFLANADGLAPQTRALLASRIAGVVRPRLSRDLQNLDDEEMLRALSS